MCQADRNVLLIKQQLLTAHDAHYAGGIHLFRCLIETLVRSGYNIQVFTVAKKALVINNALKHSLLHNLQHHPRLPNVITWQTPDRIRYWVATGKQPAASSPVAAAAAAVDPAAQDDSTASAETTLIDAVAAAAADLRGRCCCLLDADSLQHTMVTTQACSHLDSKAEAASRHCSSTDSKQLQDPRQHPAVPFMHALLQRLKQQRKQQPQQQNVQEPNQQQTLDAQQQQQQGAQSKQQSHNLTAGPQLVMLVQNLHHLPFGPSGTGTRTLLLLQAWKQVAGILCVSNYVRSYMQRYAAPLLGVKASQVLAVHPAALKVFGQGPFPDYGAAVAAALWDNGWKTAGTECSVRQQTGGHQGKMNEARQQQLQQQEDAVTQRQGLPSASIKKPCHSQQQQCQWRNCQQQQQCNQQQYEQQQCTYPVQSQQQPQQQHQAQQQHDCQQCSQLQASQQPAAPSWRQQPVVGMLKLTREKGSDIFFSLAARMPHLHFKAVCADPDMLAAAAAAQLCNVSLVPPEADVSNVLAGMSMALVPSILHEAFGMVVVDALLHGVPVVLSDAGALAEAAAGAAAAVVPVCTVSFPTKQQDQQPEQQQQQQQQQTDKCTHTDQCEASVDCWQALERSWVEREYPGMAESDYQGWMAAVQHVLSSRDVYGQYSSTCTAVAQDIVFRQAQLEADKLLRWLGGLCGQGHT